MGRYCIVLVVVVVGVDTGGAPPGLRKIVVVVVESPLLPFSLPSSSISSISFRDDKRGRFSRTRQK